MLHYGHGLGVAPKMIIVTKNLTSQELMLGVYSTF
jgi:hypothetical protein